MKMMKKIILSAGVILVVIAVVLTSVVAHFAKPVVAGQLEKSLKTKVRIDRVQLGFPLSITLINLELGDFAACEKISVYPSILGMLAGKIVLNRVAVTRPVITVVRSPDGTLVLPQPEQKAGGPAVIIAGLGITGGVVTFIDKTVSDSGYALVLDSVNIDISRASAVPGSQKVLFAISAKVGNVQNKLPGTFVFSGWVDFGPKDMDGLLRVTDVEVTSFAPYYGSVISDKKLISGRLNFKAGVKAKNNDLAAVCHLELGDLVYGKAPLPEGSLGLPDVLPGALEFFADEKGVIALDFSITSKLDNPVLEPKVLQKAVMDAALKKLSNKPPAEAAGNIESVVDQFKKLKDNYKDLFKK
ncbi:MAG: DUF748 domain-containing protein [Candidatus Omnitrophota bacterium]